MSVTNELQQSLLDTVQLISTKTANSTNATLTVKCTVVDIVDAGLGLYKVKYGDNTFEVYSYLNATFKTGDIVYVSVPDGDFSNEKMIIGASPSRAGIVIPDEEGSNIIPSPDNLFNDGINVDLNSWDNIDLKDADPIQNVGFENFIPAFTQYLEDGKKEFVFSANLKTEIDKQHQMKGNYGLVLRLPFLENNLEGAIAEPHKTYRDYIMDVHTIPGNPYSYGEYQKVNLYFNIEDGLIYDSNPDLEKDYGPSLKAFVKDFGYNEIPTRDPDIHFRDISFNMIDVIPEQEASGYSLTIVSDSGNYFMTEGKYNSQKKLTPVLKIKGKTSSVSNWDCYWFVEDSSVNIDHDRYISLGGLGWKCLNEKKNVNYDEQGNKTFEYITNSYNYIIHPDDVCLSLRYKCVLVQNETVVNSIIKISKLNDKVDLQLVSKTGSNAFVENIGYVSLLARVYYDGITNINSDKTFTFKWQRFDKDGNYIDSNFYELRNSSYVIINKKRYLEYEIAYPCTKLDKVNTINCSFYLNETNKDGSYKETILGTRSITVTTEKGFTYRLQIQGQDRLYKYDGDGDSPFVANYDGHLSSSMKTINPITYKVFKADGTELTDTEYLYCKYKWSFPTNSLMKLLKEDGTEDEDAGDGEYKYIEGYGLSSINYKIADVYNKKKSNNTILLEVTFDGVTITDSFSLRFLKDGEGGTNGSKYSAIITYDWKNDKYGYGERDGNGKLKKLQFFYVENKTAGCSWNAGWKVLNKNYIDAEDESLPRENRLQFLDTAKIENNEVVHLNSPTLSVDVYKDGEKITGDNINSYTVTWNLLDPLYVKYCLTPQSITGSKDCHVVNRIKTLYDAVINPTRTNPKAQGWYEKPEESPYILTEDTQVKTGKTYYIKKEEVVEWDDPSVYYCNVIQAEVKIGGSLGGESLVASDETIYAYYPVEIVWINSLPQQKDSIDIPQEIVIPSLDGGFEEVIYASDGTNPQFDNTNPFTCIDEIYESTDQNVYKYKWYASEKLGGKKAEKPSEEDYYLGESTNPSRKITPKTRFDDGDSANFVAVRLTWVKDYNQIKTEIEQKQIEIDQKIKEIEFYKYNKTEFVIGEDSTSEEHTDSFLEYYQKLDLNTSLTELKDFLLKRSNLLIYIENAVNAFYDIYDYCKKKDIDKNYFDWIDYYEKLIWKGQNGTLIKAYENVYLLGAGKAISNLTNLSPIVFDEENFKKQYSAGEASQLNSLVQTYNLIITQKYQKLYKDITTTATIDGKREYIYKDQYDKLEKLNKFIYGIPNYTLLANIAPLEEGATVKGLPPIQDILNLRKQLIAKTTYIKNDTKFLDILVANERTIEESDGAILSYSSLESLIKLIDETINPFLNERYQAILFDDPKDKAEQEQTKLTEEKKALTIRLLPQSSTYIALVKPIIMLYNRYGLAFLNDWDGNKLYLDEKNEQFLVAPLVGAGQKDKDNAFTGVTMGVESFNTNVNKDKQRIGLFGYSGGVHSFFLNSKDGSAIFGKPGAGQILIDPNAASSKEGTDALIYSGNFYVDRDQDGKPKSYSKSNESGEGMLINLSLPEIRFGSGNFSVDSTGYIRAVGGGWIGGWKIDDITLSSNINASQGKITLDSGAISLKGYSYKIDELLPNPQSIDPPPHKNIVIFCKEISESDLTEELNKEWIPNIKYFTEVKKETKDEDGNIIDIQITYKEEVYNVTELKIDSNKLKIYVEEKDIPIIMEPFPKYNGNSLLVGSFYTYIEEKDQDKNLLHPVIDKYINTKIGTGGKIYSHSHDTLKKGDKGFYLSYDGLSINDTVKIDAINGIAYFGYKACDATEKNAKKCWIINGAGEKTEKEDTRRSYIAYGSTRWWRAEVDEDEDNQEEEEEKHPISEYVYLGTDGIALGKKFSVNDEGELIAYSGIIGGWHLTDTTLYSDNIIIDSTGSIYVEDGWQINKDGSAIFNNITANVAGNIAGWELTPDKLESVNTIGDKGTKIQLLASEGKIVGSGFILGPTGLTLTNPDGNSSIAWGKLDGVEPGFSIDKDGTLKANNAIIKGTIYAGAGEIGGWEIDGDSLVKGNMYLNPNGDIACKNITCSGGRISVDSDTALYIGNDSLKSYVDKAIHG